MSTRSFTIVAERVYTSKDEYEVKELFRFYRHWDGYPEGHGLDMAMAVAAVDARVAAFKEYDGDLNDMEAWRAWRRESMRLPNNRNWVQMFCGELFNMDLDVEVEPQDAPEHGDVEFLYTVMGRRDAWGGKRRIDRMPVTISIHKVGWEDDYAAALAKEPLFVGSADMLIERFGRRG